MYEDPGKRYLLADDVTDAFCTLFAHVISNNFTEGEYLNLPVDAFNSDIIKHITRLCNVAINATPGWLPPTEPHYHWYSVDDIAYRVDDLVMEKYG